MLSIASILTSDPSTSCCFLFLQYNLYTHDQLTNLYTSVAEFADDKIIYTS